DHAAAPPSRTEAEPRADVRAHGIDPDRLLGKVEAVLHAAREQQEQVQAAARTRRAAVGLAVSLPVSGGLFVAAGGVRRGDRPAALVAATAGGAAVLALAALWVSLRRRGPRRGRAWLLAVALAVPAVLLAWKLLWSAQVPG